MMKGNHLEIDHSVLDIGYSMICHIKFLKIHCMGGRNWRTSSLHKNAIT
jgi:hypothetical protein